MARNKLTERKMISLLQPDRDASYENTGSQWFMQNLVNLQWNKFKKRDGFVYPFRSNCVEGNEVLSEDYLLTFRLYHPNADLAKDATVDYNVRDHHDIILPMQILTGAFFRLVGDQLEYQYRCSYNYRQLIRKNDMGFDLFITDTNTNAISLQIRSFTDLDDPFRVCQTWSSLSKYVVFNVCEYFDSKLEFLKSISNKEIRKAKIQELAEQHDKSVRQLNSYNKILLYVLREHSKKHK